MVEVEEIELDLALSIGGSFGKHTVEEPTHDSKRETSSFVSNSGGANGMHEKREIQALRRMEAKKKREQKRERVRELEQEWERGFKREKTECHNGVSNGAWMMTTTTTPFRVQQFATVQYLPLNNGFPLPCWVASEKNVGGVYGVNGGDRKPKSNGSSRCSSVVSDYQSSSREDGGSTDSHSHSVHSLVEPPQFNTTKEASIGTQPEESASASSHPVRPKQDDNHNNNTKDTKHIVKDTQPKPNLTSLDPLIKPQPPKTTNIALPIPTDKPLSSNSNSNSTNAPFMETKVAMMGKPPKPLSQTSSLPQMPYVSTKGNNGKTVNGFLYRYTKSEVSIVCVCHGSTFSPAEFVQHAGGTDTSHPLRHITVIPSAFA